MITIKELQLDDATALRLLELIKKEEPEIWEVFKHVLKQALNTPDVSDTVCSCQKARCNYKTVRFGGLPNLCSNPKRETIQ